MVEHVAMGWLVLIKKTTNTDTRFFGSLFNHLITDQKSEQTRTAPDINGQFKPGTMPTFQKLQIPGIKLKLRTTVVSLVIKVHAWKSNDDTDTGCQKAYVDIMYNITLQ